ncbi:MAG: CDP-glycerol glycerophosphotransferase family protein [Proteobacteria bacterium]|nr:CDP-glycerol glycerophosphotransferase family protein [Pseudomonadota bacterium]
MNLIPSFFQHLKQVISFKQLPKKNRQIVFYSEGKNYWVHLEGLVNELLTTYDVPVCYISSNDDDPGLLLEHPNYHSFKIDEGLIRNWLFENIEADVMVMTMPDIHQYQVKRSKNPVHYVYVQHSLVSKHMVYRKGAFDHYDSIFCAAPHHLKEIRAIEAHYNLPAKDLYEHGYARLDAIIKQAKIRPNPVKNKNQPVHVLIAPSWGPDSIIETMGSEVVDLLLKQGFKVTLRPHPQTIRFSKEKVEAIITAQLNEPLFVYEANVDGQESLHQSDIMICDWSGAALDYAFGLNKPVLFIDVPRKVNNPEYEQLGIEPYEVLIREQIGSVIAVSEIETLGDKIKSSLAKNQLKPFKSDVFSPSSSAKIGAQLLLKILKKVQAT